MRRCTEPGEQLKILRRGALPTPDAKLEEDGPGGGPARGRAELRPGTDPPASAPREPDRRLCCGGGLYLGTPYLVYVRGSKLDTKNGESSCKIVGSETFGIPQGSSVQSRAHSAASHISPIPEAGPMGAGNGMDS